jgi:hypothetical protein
MPQTQYVTARIQSDGQGENNKSQRPGQPGGHWAQPGKKAGSNKKTQVDTQAACAHGHGESEDVQAAGFDLVACGTEYSVNQRAPGRSGRPEIGSQDDEGDPSRHRHQDPGNHGSDYPLRDGSGFL